MRWHCKSEKNKREFLGMGNIISGVFFKIMEEINNRWDTAEESFGKLEGGSACHRETERNYFKKRG